MYPSMTMDHYVTRNSDGSIHVQNMVGMYEGQHHVHDQLGFAAWLENAVSPAFSSAVILLDGDCDCDLKPGEKRSGR